MDDRGYYSFFGVWFGVFDNAILIFINMSIAFSFEMCPQLGIVVYIEFLLSEGSINLDIIFVDVTISVLP